MFDEDSTFGKRAVKTFLFISKFMIFWSFNRNKAIKVNIKNSFIAFICNYQNIFINFRNSIFKKLEIMRSSFCKCNIKYVFCFWICNYLNFYCMLFLFSWVIDLFVNLVLCEIFLKIIVISYNQRNFLTAKNRFLQMKFKVKLKNPKN